MFSSPARAPLKSRQERALSRPQPATKIAIGSRIEGDGPAIVLLHSSMGSKSQWSSLTECMRGTHRLIAIDLHGYGDSAMPHCAGQFLLADEVQLVQAKLAQVLAPEERFHLVGHSFGGGVALQLAHASPERLCSLSLYEPTAFHLLDCSDPALEEVRGLAGAVEAAMHNGDRFGAAELFFDYWSGVGTHAALPPARQALFACLLPKVLLDFQALLNDPLRASDYDRIPVPTCLIVGRHSPKCVHAIASILTTVFVNRETHEIDAGHMAWLTHSALVNPIIDGFIRDVEAQGSNPSIWKKPDAFPLTHRLMGV
jgi:pimeloyl-ACP methyl ester carboxylesterase